MTARQEEFKDPDSGKLEKLKFLEQIQTKLIGDYFCYRNYLDVKVRIRKLINNDDIGFKERIIELKPLLLDKKEDCKFIQFRRIPVTSHRTIKGECAGNLTFYGDLIGVTVRNTTFIFDLDDDNNQPKEVDFIDGTDQLLTQEGFVNLGTIHIMIVPRKKGTYKLPKTVKIQTNEQVSLYFRETRIKKTFKEFAKFQTKPLDQTIKKNYEKHYSGNVWRTYSFINLLDLEHARLQMEKEEEFSFNDESILATYEGHTVFSIFLYKLQAYEKILDQLKGRDFEDEINIFSKPSENGFLRRLYRILSLPTEELQIKGNKKLSEDAEFNCRACV